MRPLARRLEKRGYASCTPTYRTYGAALPDILKALVPRLQSFRAQTNGPLHIVTHSMGGLVARALLKTARPDDLGRVVVLAPPNAGSEWADLLFGLRLQRLVLGRSAGQLRTRRSPTDEQMLGGIDFDLGVIAGDRPLDPIFPRLVLPRPNDGKVTVASTRIPGMADHLVLPVSHTLMIVRREVAAQVCAFLEHGRFSRD